MTPTGPRSFGKYLLEREIARGGMARVHLAMLRGLGGFEKRLVVKEILPELASDPRFVSMFVEEAKVLVALSHPNIVPVYELGIVDGTYFLAMEHVEGATLADLVQKRPLEPAEAARVGAEIADALAYAHERFGIVHRDVSPRNVMVDTTGHARLLDFGIAARADVGEGDALYGTPGFLSPEQARGETLGTASDLFSLGCVLVYAVKGASPFGSKELTGLRELAKAPEVELDGADPLARIVRELLAPSPSDRPSSARAVARSLAAAAGALERVEEGAASTLAARASERHAARAEPESDAAPSTPAPVTPGREESLAKSQALDVMLGTAKIPQATPTPAEAPTRDEGPGTARIERPRPVAADTTPEVGAASRPPASRVPAVVAAILAALVAIAFMWNAPFELTPIAPVDPVDRGLESPADIVPIPVEPDDATLADASVPTAPEPDAGDASTPEQDAGTTSALRPRDAGAPRGSATLTLSATPWANVSLDGRSLGTAPLRRVAIGAGTHTLRFENPALGRHVERTFRVEPGASVVLTANLDVDPPTVTVRGL